MFVSRGSPAAGMTTVTVHPLPLPAYPPVRVGANVHVSPGCDTQPSCPVGRMIGSDASATLASISAPNSAPNSTTVFMKNLPIVDPKTTTPRSLPVARGVVPENGGLKPGASTLAYIVLQRRQAVVPLAADRGHPRDRLAERRGGGGEAPLAPRALGAHEAGLLEHAEVLGHRLAGDREVGGDLRGGRGLAGHVLH